MIALADWALWLLVQTPLAILLSLIGLIQNGAARAWRGVRWVYWHPVQWRRRLKGEAEWQPHDVMLGMGRKISPPPAPCSACTTAVETWAEGRPEPCLSCRTATADWAARNQIQLDGVRGVLR